MRFVWLYHARSFYRGVAGLDKGATRLQGTSDLHMHPPMAAYRAIGARLAPNFTMTYLAISPFS